MQRLLVARGSGKHHSSGAKSGAYHNFRSEKKLTASSYTCRSNCRQYHRSRLSFAAEAATSKKSGSSVSLQDSLRKFYLKVHPDLFSQHPEQKEVNEKSFQRLMAILDEFKTAENGNQGRATATAGLLTFFFRKPKAQASPPPKSAAAAKDEEEDDGKIVDEAKDEDIEFGKVEVFVRPPDPSASLEQREKLLARQLGQSWDEEVSLQHFLKKVSERCRELGQVRQQKEQQMDIERTMFYVQHRMRILTDFPDEIARDWKQRTSTEKQLVSNLESALKSLASSQFDMETLHNCVVVFGRRRGLDLLGRVNLHLDDSIAQWLESLKAYDPSKTKEIKESGRLRSDMEKKLATRLGLAYFYADYSVAASFQYLAYIDSILKEFDADSTRRQFKDMRELKLRISDSVPNISSSSITQVAGISVDIPSCTVIVHMDTPPQTLLNYIQSTGPQLVRQHRHFVQLSETQYQVILKVKRKYQLSSLLTDPTLRFEQVESCCRRMINHAPALGNFFQGLRIYVGHEYGVQPDDGTVSIKWNWIL